MTYLNLRKNQIANLDFIPTLPSLSKLNLRENQIASIGEVKKLVSLRTLKYINIKENPIAEELGENTKRDVYIALEILKPKSINKDEVRQLITCRLQQRTWKKLKRRNKKEFDLKKKPS